MDLMPFWWSGELESVVMRTSYWCSPREKQLQEKKKERQIDRLKRDLLKLGWKMCHVSMVFVGLPDLIS